MVLTKEQLNKLIAKKEAYIDNNLKGLDKNIRELQIILFDILFEEIVADLKTEQGAIVTNTKNYTIANKVDRVFDKFSKTFQKPMMEGLGKQMLGLTVFTKEYFQKTGFEEKVINNIADKLGFLDEMIGIKDNKLVSGGFLDNLVKSPEAKREIKDFVTNSINNNTGLKDFQKGFKRLVTGAKDVDGRLLRYHKQFTYDTFNQVDEVQNSFFAEQLGLKYFIYSGTKIATTRRFCCQRFGLLFTKAQGKSWEKLNFQGKTNPYRWDINRGGYNCRHSISWLSEENAQNMFPKNFDVDGKYKRTKLRRCK
jgi:hypothetical protein